AELQTDPVNTLKDGYERLGLTFTDAAEASVQKWANEHRPGSRGAHEYDLFDYGLTPERVRASFTEYLQTYDASS
ncbi:MAG: sulfotransferase family protein, partial [Mycobacterium sp.]